MVCRLWIGAGAGVGGGDRADGQGCHDQRDVTHDRCEQAGLGLLYFVGDGVLRRLRFLPGIMRVRIRQGGGHRNR
jgi:hypothetical protein